RDYSNGKGNQQNGSGQGKTQSEQPQQFSSSQVGGYQSADERKQHGASPPPPPPPPQWQPNTPQAALDFDKDQDEEESEQQKHQRSYECADNLNHKYKIDPTSNGTGCLEGINPDFLEQSNIENITDTELQQRNETEAPKNENEYSNAETSPQASSSSDEEMVFVDEVFIVPLQSKLMKADEPSKSDESPTLVSRQVQRYGRSKRHRKDSDTRSESSDLPSVSEVGSVDTLDGATDVDLSEGQENQERLPIQASIDTNLLKPESSLAPRKKVRRKSKQTVEYELDDDEEEAGIKLEYVTFDNNKKGKENVDEKISQIATKSTNASQNNENDKETHVHKVPGSHSFVEDVGENDVDTPKEETCLPQLTPSLNQGPQQAKYSRSEDVPNPVSDDFNQDFRVLSEALAKEMISGDTLMRLEAEKAKTEAYSHEGDDAERLHNLNTLCIATSFEPPVKSGSQPTSKNIRREPVNNEDGENMCNQNSAFKFETWESKSIYNFEDEKLRSRANQRRNVRHASCCESHDTRQTDSAPYATGIDKDTNQGPYPHGLGFFWQTPVESTRGTSREASFERANSVRLASLRDDPFALSNYASDTLVFPLPRTQTDQNSNMEALSPSPPVENGQVQNVEDVEILALAETMLINRSCREEEPDEEVCQELIKQWDEESEETGSLADSTHKNKPQETTNEPRDLEILVLAGELLRSGDTGYDNTANLSADLVKEWDSEYKNSVATRESAEENNGDNDHGSLGQRHQEVLECTEEAVLKINRVNLPSFQEVATQTTPLEIELIPNDETNVHKYAREVIGSREETIEEGPSLTLAPDTDIRSTGNSSSKGIQVSLRDRDLKEGEVSYRREETEEQHKPSIQQPKTLESGPDLTENHFTQNFNASENRPRSVSDPVSPRSEELSSLWRPEFISGREIVISAPPVSTVHPVSLYHSLSTPVLSANEEPHGNSKRSRRRSGRLSNYTHDKDRNSDQAEENPRERSPLLRRSHVHENNVDMTISNQQILNEIEKLKNEHSKMMDLLERSKERKARKERGKSSTSSLAETDSSGGDSPVTVIAGPGSMNGSNTVSPTSTPSSQTSSPPNIGGSMSAFRATDEISARIRGFGVANDLSSCLRRNLDIQDSPRSSEESKEQPVTNLGENESQVTDFIEERDTGRTEQTHQTPEELDSSLNEQYDQGESSFEDNIEDLLLRVPDFASVGPRATSFDDANVVVQKRIPTKDACTSPVGEFVSEGRKSTSPTQQYDKRTADLIKAATETLSVRTHQDSAGDQWSTSESLSPVSRVSVVSPLTLHAILDDDDEMTDADSAFSMSTAATSAERHRRHHIQMVSTGTDASVDNLDDSTQTEDTDVTYDDSTLHSSMLGGAHGGASSDSSGHEMSMVHRELDRLHRERVEIIELLSLHYLPSSLTVELLEAKLNYCIGQTDTLLATLEDAWAMEDENEKHPRRSKKVIKVSQHYLNEYRSEFIRSKRDIESCLETHQRRQTGARGRRRTRGRDVRAMRRRAEIEAFKLERLKEQCRYEREMNNSRRRTTSQSSVSLDDSSSVASSSFHQTDPSHRRRMMPSQRKDHLVALRKQIVQSTAGEMLDMRNRSMSPRSPSDSYWALQPSYSAPHSPARSESPGVGSSGRDTFSQFRRGSNSSWHSVNHRLGRSPARSLPDTAAGGLLSVDQARPRSLEPVSSSRTLEDVSGTSVMDNLSLDLRTNVMVSLSGPDLSADRLIEESNEVRRQNQRQIEKAREMLRHLDEKRSQMRGASQPVQSSQSPRKSQSMEAKQERSPVSSTNATPLTSSTEFRMKFSRDLAPGQTSSPRVPLAASSSTAPSSFTEYARDHLVRGQRQIDSWVGRQPHLTHHFYTSRDGTSTDTNLSSSSLDRPHRFSSPDHHSPASGFSRRLGSSSPAYRSLSSENRWRPHSSDSAGSVSSQAGSRPAGSSLSRHRSAGAYHPTNYLRPLSMNYPAHRHFMTNPHPALSSSGVSLTTHAYKDSQAPRSTASSRSSSRGRTASDHH
ncbi:hypothetical protein EGW08_005679, partial [Elysia chlorotica]